LKAFWIGFLSLFNLLTLGRETEVKILSNQTRSGAVELRNIVGLHN